MDLPSSKHNSNPGNRSCSAHEGMVVRVNLIEQEQENMNTRLGAVESKVYSPAVMVAVIGLVGTIVTVAGSVLSVVLMAVLKSHGVM